jgi:hypothetical protein
MSSDKSPLVPLVRPQNLSDPQQLELVRKILEKSKEGKLNWKKSTDGTVFTSVGQRLAISFSHSKTNPLAGWSTFLVKDAQQVILSVSNVNENALLALVTGSTRSPLELAVQNLYTAVNSALEAGMVQSAIKLLDEI